MEILIPGFSQARTLGWN